MYYLVNVVYFTFIYKSYVRTISEDLKFRSSRISKEVYFKISY